MYQTKKKPLLVLQPRQGQTRSRTPTPFRETCNACETFRASGVRSRALMFVPLGARAPLESHRSISSSGSSWPNPNPPPRVKATSSGSRDQDAPPHGRDQGHRLHGIVRPELSRLAAVRAKQIMHRCVSSSAPRTFPPTVWSVCDLDPPAKAEDGGALLPLVRLPYPPPRSWR